MSNLVEIIIERKIMYGLTDSDLVRLAGIKQPAMASFETLINISKEPDYYKKQVSFAYFISVIRIKESKCRLKATDCRLNYE